jgi:hypothetical protein
LKAEERRAFTEGDTDKPGSEKSGISFSLPGVLTE